MIGKITPITFILLAINIGIIHAQKKYEEETEKLYIPTLTQEFETFDTIRYKRIKENNETYGNEILHDSIEVFMKKNKNYYVYSETYPNSYFFINKLYYPNGNIMRKGLGFNYEDFPKGIWYFFDEQGNRTETIDYDAPFKFTFEKVLDFCKKEGIVFKTGDIEWAGEYHPSIRREYKPGLDVCYWQIEWLNRRVGKIEIIKLDGITGKEISREYMDYIM